MGEPSDASGASAAAAPPRLRGDLYGSKHRRYDAAAACEHEGGYLCTEPPLHTGSQPNLPPNCKGAGCSYDQIRVWTNISCPVPTPEPTLKPFASIPFPSTGVIVCTIPSVRRVASTSADTDRFPFEATQRVASTPRRPRGLSVDESRRRRGARADRPWTSRGGAAAATRIVHVDESRLPASPLDDRSIPRRQGKQRGHGTLRDRPARDRPGARMLSSRRYVLPSARRVDGVGSRLSRGPFQHRQLRGSNVV